MAGTFWFIKIILFKGLVLRIIAFSLLGKTQRVNAYKDSLKLLFKYKVSFRDILNILYKIFIYNSKHMNLLRR